jgi:hypothetical protein
MSCQLFKARTAWSSSRRTRRTAGNNRRGIRGARLPLRPCLLIEPPYDSPTSTAEISACGSSRPPLAPGIWPRGGSRIAVHLTLRKPVRRANRAKSAVRIGHLVAVEVTLRLGRLMCGPCADLGPISHNRYQLAFGSARSRACKDPGMPTRHDGRAPRCRGGRIGDGAIVTISRWRSARHAMLWRRRHRTAGLSLRTLTQFICRRQANFGGNPQVLGGMGCSHV